MTNENCSAKIRDYLLKESNVIKLLDEVNSHYPVESNYEGAKFESKCVQSGMILKSTKTNGVKDILIHVKVGEPSTDQVYDSIYQYLDDVRERIIVFTGESNYLDQGNPTADTYVVQSLIEALNQYPLSLYLVQLDTEALMSDRLSIEVISGPASKVQFGMDEIPNELKFREDEFWNVYYDRLNEAFYCSYEAFTGGLFDEKDFGYYIEGSYAETYTDWTEDGFLYRAVSKNGYEDFIIQKMYQLMSADQFPTTQLKMSYKPNNFIELELVTHPIPSSILTTSDPDEKVAYANLLYSGFHKFHYFFEDND